MCPCGKNLRCHVLKMHWSIFVLHLFCWIVERFIVQLYLNVSFRSASSRFIPVARQHDATWKRGATSSSKVGNHTAENWLRWCLFCILSLIIVIKWHRSDFSIKSKVTSSCRQNAFSDFGLLKMPTSGRCTDVCIGRRQSCRICRIVQNTVLVCKFIRHLTWISLCN